jgi:Predicted amidohydrolase
MKTAICQFAATYDTDANLQICTALIADADAAGADLVVLPEASMYFDPLHERSAEGHGQSVDGVFVNALAELARAAGITVVAGMTESVDGDGRDSNTLVALSPQGQMIGVLPEAAPV